MPLPLATLPHAPAGTPLPTMDKLFLDSELAKPKLNKRPEKMQAGTRKVVKYPLTCNTLTVRPYSQQAFVRRICNYPVVSEVNIAGGHGGLVLDLRSKRNISSGIALRATTSSR